MAFNKWLFERLVEKYNQAVNDDDEIIEKIEMKEEKRFESGEFTVEDISEFSQEEIKEFIRSLRNNRYDHLKRILDNNSVDYLKSYVIDIYKSNAIDEEHWNNRPKATGPAIISEILYRKNSHDFIPLDGNIKESLSIIGFELPNLPLVSYENYNDALNFCKKLGKHMFQDNEYSMRNIVEFLYYIVAFRKNNKEEFDKLVKSSPYYEETNTPIEPSFSSMSDVFINEEYKKKMINILLRKKNIILQGPPGVGKTFIAERLAQSIVDEVDYEDCITTIQFHQSYSYEDFFMGYRPEEEGFKLATGPFFDFCKEASRLENEDKKFVFIIDEINRGNLSRIFGELFMLIEADKRGKAIKPLYSDIPFSIPENVYIIGTMNTADRSLAMLDYALRRRFAFFDIPPAFDNDAFIKHMKCSPGTKLDVIIEKIKKLNLEIENDSSLGIGFRIGHSYFLGETSIDIDNHSSYLDDIIEYEIIPLLQEYWFDNSDKVDYWSRELKSVS